MAEQEQRGTMPKLAKKEKIRLGILLAAGLALMIGGGLWQQKPARSPELPLAESLPEPSPAGVAVQLEQILTQVAGAGVVTVGVTYGDEGTSLYLTEQSRTAKEGDGTKEETTAVTLATGGSQNEPVLVNRELPEIQGVVVVAAGADDPAVRVALTEAAANLLGVGVNRITVLPRQPDLVKNE